MIFVIIIDFMAQAPPMVHNVFRLASDGRQCSQHVSILFFPLFKAIPLIVQIQLAKFFRFILSNLRFFRIYSPLQVLFASSEV